MGEVRPFKRGLRGEGFDYLDERRGRWAWLVNGQRQHVMVTEHPGTLLSMLSVGALSGAAKADAEVLATECPASPVSSVLHLGRLTQEGSIALSRQLLGVPVTPTLPPLAEAELGAVLRDEGMAAAAAGAGPEWIARAEETVRRVARQAEEFTSDDVWDAGLEKPAEPRALGPVMLRLAREAVIVPTGEWRASRYSSRHIAPIRVWTHARKESMP